MVVIGNGFKRSVAAILPCAMSFSSSFSVPTVRAIAKLLDEAQLSEIVIETDGAHAPQRLVVRREVTMISKTPSGAVATPTAEVATETPPTTDSNLVMVPSPTVGYFHHMEKPVGMGGAVRAGQTIGNVETMGIPNDVAASVEGRVVEILVAEGQGVAFGQPLFVIEKESPKES